MSLYVTVFLEDFEMSTVSIMGRHRRLGTNKDVYERSCDSPNDTTVSLCK
jgi:hypothetical protein